MILCATAFAYDCKKEELFLAYDLHVLGEGGHKCNVQLSTFHDSWPFDTQLSINFWPQNVPALHIDNLLVRRKIRE